MRVITLDRGAFELHAGRLAALVAADDSIGRFDAVIGVKRGGSVVCDAFCRHFSKDSYALRTDVFLQRPSTKLKTGPVNRALKKLPLKLLDMLRMFESRLMSVRRKLVKNRNVPHVVLPDELMRALCEKQRPVILIIDDAIDSGDTLYAVIKSLTDVNPSARIKVAVMTVTTSDPVVYADYSLYRNHTLIRFPWSNDFRK